ncbi:MAG: hypothetical protein ACXV8U_22610 [Methylobacter sp.]
MNEVKVISEIDEEIKSIVYSAKNNSLTAINALLVAKQAGMKAIGFSVVAHELKLFKIWSQITSRFVGVVGWADMKQWSEKR